MPRVPESALDFLFAWGSFLHCGHGYHHERLGSSPSFGSSVLPLADLCLLRPPCLQQEAAKRHLQPLPGELLS